MMPELYVGVDVAKDWLDIYHPHRGARRIHNASAALKAFSAACAKEGAWIVFEASGGYDHLLRAALEAAHVIMTRVRACSSLKDWGMAVARRRGARRAKLALARKLGAVHHGKPATA